MIIKNVLVYTEEKRFEKGAVWIEGERIAGIWLQEQVLEEEQRKHLDVQIDGEAVLDGLGGYLIPGMIDIHTHGCKGYDFCDDTMEAVEQIARHQAKSGVTTFVPATMTLPVERLESILRIGVQYQRQKENGAYPEYADLAGINMEGPFISRAKKGAQNEAYIVAADVGLYGRFQQAAEGLIKYIGIAPEEGDTTDFIEQVKAEAVITLAHSNADYETAKAAFEAGASHVTHLYNGMSAYNHREPGIVGAVADCGHVEAELIGDGVHVHPAVIRSTFKMLGGERILLISDSIRAAGMPDGTYELGGQKVTVRGNLAVLEDGTIAGSVASLPECLRYVVQEAGIPLEEVVACVTVNPAKSLGIYERCGSVSVGKQADLVLLDEELKVQAVVKAGQVVNIKNSKGD
ncbi:MAG: N-acetylglucosamine-6-phosphate deacetylase [Lachnospiraceae bacterium]|nr:N-acetylglucosamine-6-phosphate deacetylase [Lachnospiraceae bacterium]